jgi:hypothetical protein
MQPTGVDSKFWRGKFENQTTRTVQLQVLYSTVRSKFFNL